MPLISDLTGRSYSMRLLTEFKCAMAAGLKENWCTDESCREYFLFSHGLYLSVHASFQQ